MDTVKREDLLNFPKGDSDIFKERMKRENLKNRVQIIDYLHRNTEIPIENLSKMNVSKLDEHHDPWHPGVVPRNLHEHLMNFWSDQEPNADVILFPQQADIVDVDPNAPDDLNEDIL